MRLIHAKTLKLENFPDERQTPPYAILSHTWSDGEILYKDLVEFETRRDEPTLNWRKIYLACRQAISDSLEYVWIDTCCIDKTSSAELSEGINSMFRWYGNATVCYAYLSDVLSTPSKGEADDGVLFERSRWFSRGWTLQELLAPAKVVFYDRDWTCLGTKEALRLEISKTTKIRGSILDGTEDLRDVSVAAKMSWAAGRRTSRVEDEAYCLLGIFDVNMPLLYGEGTKAFARLQEEILRTADDHSILAWSGEGTQLLASSPDAFTGASTIAKVENVHRPHLEMTKRGISISVMLGAIDEHQPSTALAILDCTDLNRLRTYVALLVVIEAAKRGSYGEIEQVTEVKLPPDRNLHLIDGIVEKWPYLSKKEDLLMLHGGSGDQSRFKNSPLKFGETPVQLVLSSELQYRSISLYPPEKWQPSELSTTLSHWSSTTPRKEERVVDINFGAPSTVADGSGDDDEHIVTPEADKDEGHLIITFGYRFPSNETRKIPRVYLDADICPTSPLPEAEAECWEWTPEDRRKLIRKGWFRPSVLEGWSNLPLYTQGPSVSSEHGSIDSHVAIRWTPIGTNGSGWTVIISSGWPRRPDGGEERSTESSLQDAMWEIFGEFELKERVAHARGMRSED